MATKIGSDARGFMHRTGLEKLPESALKKVDKNNDGEVSLKEAVSIATRAGMDGDGRLSRDERARTRTVLGETRGQQLPAEPMRGGIQSVLAARAAPGDRRLPEGYMERKIEARPDGLAVSIDFTEYDRDTNALPEKSGTAFIPGLVVNGFDGEFFGADGNTGIAGYESAKFAAGMIIGVADEHLGLVLVDVTAKDAIRDKEPEMSSLLSPKNLAARAAVKRAAKKAGLNTRGLQVQVNDVKLSGGGYADKHTMTVGMEVTLTDKNGKCVSGLEFSSTLKGDPSRGLGAMKMGKLEEGLDASWGWLYPPSVTAANDDDSSSTSSTDDSSSSYTGGSESYSRPSPTPSPRRTGGSESSSGSYRNWGGGE